MGVSRDVRDELNSIHEDRLDRVRVGGGFKRIGWIKPDVNYRLNGVIDGAVGLRAKAQIPHKLVALAVLNGVFRIKFFYWFLWRWYYYVRGYSYADLVDAVVLIKKKIQLDEYWLNMALSVEVMSSWKTLMEKEAEEYRQELTRAEQDISEKSKVGL